MNRENPGTDFSQREELEARLVAMLMGEADGPEVVTLSRLMAQDPELAVFYKRMETTVGLIRDASSTSEERKRFPVKLSQERKEKLFDAWENEMLQEADGGVESGSIFQWRKGGIIVAAAASAAFALWVAWSPYPRHSPSSLTLFSEEVEPERTMDARAENDSEYWVEPIAPSDVFYDEGLPFFYERSRKYPSPVDPPADPPMEFPEAFQPMSSASLKSVALANRAVAPEVDQVAWSHLAFGVDLYHALRHEEGNLFFSPAGLSTAMAMTYGGARGETARQIKEVFSFFDTGEPFHVAYEAWIDGLHEASSRNGGEVFQQMNALWGQKGVGFIDDFLSIIGHRYGGALHEVDFVNKAEEARHSINGLIEELTQGGVKDFLPEGSVCSDTRMVLANALRFRGEWALPFDPEKTRSAPFRTSSGESIEVPLMNRQGRFGYFEEDGGLQVIEIPYAGDAFSMLVFLPKEPRGLEALEERLAPDAIEEWRAQLRQQAVNLYLPRFEMTSRFSLKQILSGMGMPDAFSRSADFSGMNSGEESLFIKDMLHDAYIEVNEAGSEAGAATGIVMNVLSMPPLFMADRPFLFLIREEETGSVLFVGRMAVP